MPFRFINPNFHVILVHYPLGVFVLGVALELLGFMWRRSTVRTAARWMIVLGAMLSLPAATSGLSALLDVRNQGITNANYEMMRLHVIFMSSASILAILCAVVGIGASDRWRKYLYLPLLLGVVAAWGGMVLGAWNAGEAVYRRGTAVVIEPSAVADVKVVASNSPVSPGEKVDFATQIHPIFAADCYKCHAGSKDKGDLRLDSVDRIRKGGKDAGASVIVPGSPDKSDLFHRITLPSNDEDVMPPTKKGDHLTRQQTDLIKAWIAQGADFGAWKEDTDLAVATADAKAALDKAQHDLLASATGGLAQNADASQVVDKPHHEDIITAIKTANRDELMNFYGGGALQQHLILAGFAFAAAFLALGLSIRRVHSTTVAPVPPPAPVEPPVHSQGQQQPQQRRVADDETVLRSFNPRATMENPHAAAPRRDANQIPSGRMWLFTTLVIIGAAGLGYWLAAGTQNVLSPQGWTIFVNQLKPIDTAVKVNRVAAHVILGGSFLGLSLFCALVAAFAPKKPILLGVVSVALIAVIAAQVWMGVLLTFDGKDKHDASLLHFQTDVEAKQQQEREAAQEKAAQKAPDSTPATTAPSAAPATEPTALQSVP